jgi:peptide/nickel transport system permease protein
MTALQETATTEPASRRDSLRIASAPMYIAAFVLLVVLVCVVFGPLIGPDNPYAINLDLGVTGPSLSHLLGTDTSGRDILSMLVVGARTAVFGPVLIALVAGVAGSVLGVSAGYLGRRVDTGIMRVMELLYSLPGILVVIVVVGVLGGGYLKSSLLLAILAIPSDTRILRGAVLQERSKPYVEAARTLGLSRTRIMARHLWPNLLPYVVVNAFLNFSNGLVWLASLDYLGFGVRPGSADWGLMLQANVPIIRQNVWAVMAPGLCIVITALAMNVIGNGLYERLEARGRAR